MAEHTCFNCSYCICDPCLWLSLMRYHEPILPRCANHPLWPGQLHEVPGVPCRRYHPRPTLPEGDNVRMIALTDGAYAYVDAADFEWLNQWNWHDEAGYAARYENGKLVFMHREIMQPPKGKVVDHTDGNKANNCRFNLRNCNALDNIRNQRKRKGAYSIYKGVFYSKDRHKWGARCYEHGERIWLGYFDTEGEAARAYDRQAVKSFGEFARVNFPREWPPERRAQVHAEWQEASQSKKAKVKRKKARSDKGGKSGWEEGQQDREVSEAPDRGPG